MATGASESCRSPVAGDWVLGQETGWTRAGSRERNTVA